MGTTTHRVARPKFYDHFTPIPQPSAHECHCGENAVFIDGYYLVGQRRVRVWVCAEHKLGFPTKVLPVPAHIQAALDAEEEYLEKMRRTTRYNADSEDSESVKFLAPTGHGEPIPYDRVAAWRWGGF